MAGLSGVRYGHEIAAAAARNGVNAQLLAAVAAQETGGPTSNSGSNVVGDGGHGRGLFQIDDRWHAFASTSAAADPAANADYAAGMLAGLLRRFGGDVHAALSAYNAGSPDATGTVTTWPDGQRLGYADSVLRHLAQLDGASPGGASPGSVGPGAPSYDVPQATPLLPSDQPPLQPFRSYASELATAGAACEDADRRMAALIDPSDAGASDGSDP